MRVEKRLPFGFRGDWGRLYKENIKSNESIECGGVIYYVLDDDIQFKELEKSESSKVGKSVPNLVLTADSKICQTTDAYFDDTKREYASIVQVGDIVKAFGEWWIVEVVESESIFTPRRQTVYNLVLQKIFEKVVVC